MITFAGFPLLSENIDGKLTEILDRYMPLSDMSLWGCLPENYRSYQHGALADRPVPIGLPRMNWPPRWRVRINSLFWPSGATRWAQFVGICTWSTLQQILGDVENEGQNVARQLVLADQRWSGDQPPPYDAFTIDPNGLFCISTSMYLLQPRQISQPIAGGDTLWLLPLVDERYYWQWRSGDVTDIGGDTDTPMTNPTGFGSWNAMLQSLVDRSDNVSAGLISEIIADFIGPDAIHWNRPGTLGVMMDAAALACGLRIVRDIGGAVSALNFSDSQQFHQTNWAPSGNPLEPSGQLICGGDFSSVHQMGSQPGGVEIIFTPHPGDKKVYGADVSAIDSTGIPSKVALSTDAEASGGFTPGVKRFFTTARAVDDATATKFAKAVAKDFYGWKKTAFDLIYAGIKPWRQTGFDDAVEWRFDWAPELADPESGYKGGYALQTRVQSLPANCGFSDLPHVIDFEGWRTVVVKLLEPLGSMGRASASIQKIIGGSQMFDYDPQRIVKIGDGLGLCEPAKIGTLFYAQEYPGIGYMATAAHCDCTSS